MREKTGISGIGSTKRINASGFTFLELTIVLLIAALFSTLLVARIEGRFSGGDLSEASRVVIRQIMLLRGLAAFRHQTMTLGLDMDRNALYTVEASPVAEKSSGRPIHDKAEEADYLPLPSGIFLEDTLLEGKGKVQGGAAQIRFYANGCVDRALIHLRNEKNRFYTLEINPLTGRVKIYDTYVDRQISD